MTTCTQNQTPDKTGTNWSQQVQAGNTVLKSHETDAVPGQTWLLPTASEEAKNTTHLPSPEKVFLEVKFKLSELLGRKFASIYLEKSPSVTPKWQVKKSNIIAQPIMLLFYPIKYSRIVT